MSSIAMTRLVLSAPRPLALALVTAATLTAASPAPASEPFRASAKLDTENYVAEIVAPGPFKVGAEASAKVTLTTKGAYHINPQYPYRFKAAAAANGITYPKPVLQRADGQFEEKRAVFNVAFVASQAGHFDVGGVLHMSVCSADNCLVDKPALAVTVDVQ